MLRIPRVSANPTSVQARPVTPPVTGPDFGLGANSKMLAGTSRHMGPIGNSSGRFFWSRRKYDSLLRGLKHERPL